MLLARFDAWISTDGRTDRRRVGARCRLRVKFHESPLPAADIQSSPTTAVMNEKEALVVHSCALRELYGVINLIVQHS